MGLTIHYNLKFRGEQREARQVIDQLRSRARDLPFAKVSDVVELSGADCAYEQRGRDDPLRWLIIQSGQYLELPPKGNAHFHAHVPPTHLIAFETIPGEGSEPANFGLCKYPATIDVNENRHPDGHVKRRTGLSGWRWGSFCKTQYASNKECGGVQNFLKCHLAVIRLLDRAKELGILEHVSDEGDYWEKRDIPSLAKEVGEWNDMLANFVGQLKDLLGDGIEAPIAKFPDFEHLEARGRSSST